MPVDNVMDGVFAPLAQGIIQGQMMRQQMAQTTMQQQAARRIELRQQHQDQVDEEERRQRNEDRDRTLTREFQQSGRRVGKPPLPDSVRYNPPPIISGSWGL